jgi:hypothetical protein
MIVITPTQIKGEVAPPPLPKLACKKNVPKICVLISVVLIVFVLILFRIYGIDTKHKTQNTKHKTQNTKHETRGSIWWPERGRNLIPPTASEITLRRDLLDHYALYTVAEKELNAFLDKRFGRPRESLSSFSERLPVEAETIGKVMGPFGWEVTADTVSYVYCASNGGAHYYYHDTKSGLTYQISAHW